MKYAYISAPSYLKDCVKCFWMLDHQAVSQEILKFGTIADGTPGLVIHLTGNTIQCAERLPNSFLYGQTTAYTEIVAPVNFITLGVYFYPHALKYVFGMDAYELSNKCLDIDLLEGVNGGQLQEQLITSNSLADQIAILANFLYKLVCRHGKQDNILNFMLHRINEKKGMVSLRELRMQAGWSERTLERKFKEQVGISPKLFARICQFQGALDIMRNDRYAKLTEIAYKKAYADQSHFIRAFKEFTSFTPSQYLKASKEVITNFPQIL